MDMFCPTFLLVSFSCQSSGTIFRKREATRRFVETSEWPEQKSSESSEQIVYKSNVKTWVCKSDLSGLQKSGLRIKWYWSVNWLAGFDQYLKLFYSVWSVGEVLVFSSRL